VLKKFVLRFPFLFENPLSYYFIRRWYDNKLRERLKKPPFVGIENTNICNSACIMCPHSQMKRQQGIMDVGWFEKIVDKCRKDGIKEVGVAFFGEPLADPHIFKRIRYVKKKGMAAYTFTNGSLLTEEKARKLLDSGVDKLTISIDGATKEVYEKIRRNLKFDIVMNNVERFLKMRKEMKSSNTFVAINMVVLKENEHEKEMFFRKWHPYIKGIGAIEFSHANNWGGKKVITKIPKGAICVPCDRLWDTLPVNWKGKSVLCCHDYESAVATGDLTKSKGINDVWFGPALKKIRELHLKGEWDKIQICRGCSHNYLVREPIEVKRQSTSLVAVDKMRSMKCNLCGSDNCVTISRKARFGIRVNNVVCKSCGLVYINPRPEKKYIDKFYLKRYREIYSGSDNPKEFDRQKSQDQDVIDRLEFMERGLGYLKPRLKTRRVLDIGCATGYLFPYFKNKGWDFMGIEPSKSYSEYGRKKYGTPIVNSTLENVKLKRNFYDFIIMSHVLEHLDNPAESLKLLHGSMRPGALLYIEVPNIMKPYGHLNNFFQNAHLYNFSPQTLRKICAKYGFSLEKMESSRTFIKALFTKTNKHYKGAYKNPKHAEEVLSFIKRYRAATMFSLEGLKYLGAISLRHILKLLFGKAYRKRPYQTLET